MKDLLLITTGGTISQEQDEHTGLAPANRDPDTFITQLNGAAQELNINIVPMGIFD